MEAKEYSNRDQHWLELFGNYRLSPYQQKIVALGIDGREISSQDMYQAINTQDSTVYDREVSALRIRKVLIEIRTAGVARKLARKIKQPIQTIPRFKIQIPAHMAK